VTTSDNGRIILTAKTGIEMDGNIDYQSLDKTLRFFINSGFRLHFVREPSGLYCPEEDLRLAPDEFSMINIYHFQEGTSVEEILFLVATYTGARGTLVLPIDDVYDDNMSFEMAQKLRIHPFGEWICS
jgi:hypothetical protein